MRTYPDPALTGILVLLAGFGTLRKEVSPWTLPLFPLVVWQVFAFSI
jgi:hypothetical protein